MSSKKIINITTDTNAQGQTTMTAKAGVDMNALAEQLKAIIGEANVFTDESTCTLYAQDVFTKTFPAQIVIKPKDVTSLSKATKLVTDSGVAIVPRGGGMSYTKGYVPIEKNSVMVDTQALDSVLEINEQDMYVRVQAGCTWQALQSQLAETGLRTPFWGTLSGAKATVGGGISQNSIFWGSGQFGFAVDSVLSMQVVLADGSLLDTGAAAHINGSPFMRHYGPDITGLFCGDNAAFGIKTEITLRLMPAFACQEGISFCFETFEQQSAVMSEVARQNLVSECCGFDPFLQAQRLKRDSLSNDVKSLLGVMKSAGGLGKALKQGAKVALAGRSFVEENCWSVHFFVEDRTESAVQQRLEQINRIASEHQAISIENTIPKVLRANPFGPVNNMIGPNGERWAPVHTLVPHSKAIQAHELSEAVFKKHHQAIEQHNIGIGYLLAIVSTNVFVLEPVFFWPDELNELHRDAVENSHLKRIHSFDANPEGRAAVTKIREDLIQAYLALGGTHMQIGKTYPYKESLADNNFKLLQALKKLVDPNNRINPGALGL